MMIYKQFNENAFKFLEAVGMRVSKCTEVNEKYSIGVRMGLTNLVTVLFGLFSVKLVNIPLYLIIYYKFRFLTFRRCSILTTVLMGWIITSSIPDRKLSISLILTAIGAFFASVIKL
jgi:hypothetical protein